MAALKTLLTGKACETLTAQSPSSYAPSGPHHSINLATARNTSEHYWFKVNETFSSLGVDYCDDAISHEQ